MTLGRCGAGPSLVASLPRSRLCAIGRDPEELLGLYLRLIKPEDLDRTCSFEASSRHRAALEAAKNWHARHYKTDQGGSQ